MSFLQSQKQFHYPFDFPSLPLYHTSPGPGSKATETRRLCLIQGQTSGKRLENGRQVNKHTVCILYVMYVISLPQCFH